MEDETEVTTDSVQEHETTSLGAGGVPQFTLSESGQAFDSTTLSDSVSGNLWISEYNYLDGPYPFTATIEGLYTATWGQDATSSRNSNGATDSTVQTAQSIYTDTIAGSQTIGGEASSFGSETVNDLLDPATLIESGNESATEGYDPATSDTSYGPDYHPVLLPAGLAWPSFVFLIFRNPSSADPLGPYTAGVVNGGGMSAGPYRDAMRANGLPWQGSVPDGVAREAPPSPTAVLTALAAPGRNPADLTLPTVGTQATDPPGEGSNLKPGGERATTMGAPPTPPRVRQATSPAGKGGERIQTMGAGSIEAKPGMGPRGPYPPPSLDDLQTALDVAGVVDPTGAADLASAGISVYKEDYTGAAISVAAIFGFDFLKGLKRFRKAKDVAEGAADVAQGAAKQADEVAPLVKNADEAAAEVKAADAAAGAPTSKVAGEIDPNKFKYVFGEITSGAHHTQRSLQNAAQMNKIGIHNAAEGQAYLTSHLQGVVQDPSNVARTFQKTLPSGEVINLEVRESLLSGPGGFLKLESTWQVLSDGTRRLTTVIPFGG